MNVLLINGSPHAKGCTHTALEEVASQLHQEGIQTTELHIGTKEIHPCIACGACAKTGYCIFKDDPCNQAIELGEKADGLIVGSPVYYAAPNGGLCSLLDRMFFMKSYKYAYFTISCMPVVSSQYWNAVHGMTPAEVKKDAEGLQIMRTLGQNMAWLLKCIDSCKTTHPHPVREPQTMTNFIRE